MFANTSPKIRSPFFFLAYWFHCSVYSLIPCKWFPNHTHRLFYPSPLISPSPPYPWLSSLWFTCLQPLNLPSFVHLFGLQAHWSSCPRRFLSQPPCWLLHWGERKETLKWILMPIQRQTWNDWDDCFSGKPEACPIRYSILSFFSFSFLSLF